MEGRERRNPDDFYFECPVWVILEAGTEEPNERLAFAEAVGHKLLFVFTDQNLVDRFLAGCQPFGWVAHHAEEMDEFADILRRAAVEGATDVGIDTPPFGIFPVTGWFFLLTDMIASVERRV